MTKRLAISLIIPALLINAAQAVEIINKDANKLELSGRANALHYFSKSDSSNGDRTYVRFGFKGETQISELLTGFGNWEYNIQANNSEGGSDSQNGNKTRLGFAGLRYADNGEFSYGRNYGLVYDAIGFTDKLPEFGGDSANADNFLSSRATGVATYRNRDFFGAVDGLDFALQYQGKNNRSDAQQANGDGWAISTTYTSDMGLGFATAYAKSNRTDAQNSLFYGNGKNAEQWAAAVKYELNNYYLGAMYGETRNATPLNGTYDGLPVTGFANKAQNFEVVAQYLFDFQKNGALKPSLAYVQSKARKIEDIGSADLYRYISLGATYTFNVNILTYVDYKINLLNSDNKLGQDNKDIVAVGLVYQF